MLRRITSSPSKLWMGRGSNGATTQEISVGWNGFEALITTRRIHKGEVTVYLEREEIEALVSWLGDHIGGVEGLLAIRAEAARRLTAMDIVRRAQRGEIERDELVRELMRWEFDPQYKAKGEADDWVSIGNSFDAVEYAHSADLLSDDDYDAIVAEVARRDEESRRLSEQVENSQNPAPTGPRPAQRDDEAGEEASE